MQNFQKHTASASHQTSALFSTPLSETNFTWLGPKYIGKVRDVYDKGDSLVLIATDRQSAFDIPWCSIPLKGQVLTQLSVWWFEQVKAIIPNHLIASPDPNTVVVKKLKMFPVEVVVRDYLTGSTETSIWVKYSRGERDFCGTMLPEGMKKNQKLPSTIITPTTKGEHDRPITPEEIVTEGLISEEHWQTISEAALKLFKFGQKVALDNNLILVDTKYEFGLDSNGVVNVGDEVHTPDSSRYWLACTCNERLRNGQEPESLDKEFFRNWLVQNGFQIEKGFDSYRPTITPATISALSQKYIELFQQITGRSFKAEVEKDAAARIERNLRNYFSPLP